MASLYNIERFAYDAEKLHVEVVELLEGEPDGMIGLPLVVRSNSRRYRLMFADVGRILVEPEPMSAPNDGHVQETPFLLRNPASPLLTEHRWGATTFNFGRRFANESELKHYEVVGEKFVIHVLTLAEPEIVEC